MSRFPKPTKLDRMVKEKFGSWDNFARVLPCSFSHIGKIRSGLARPSVDLARVMATALDGQITLDELMPSVSS